MSVLNMEIPMTSCNWDTLYREVPYRMSSCRPFRLLYQPVNYSYIWQIYIGLLVKIFKWLHFIYLTVSLKIQKMNIAMGTFLYTMVLPLSFNFV